MKRCFAFLLTVFVALSLTAFAHAGTYPDKSIKIIVPFNPGGGGEQGARLLEKDFKEVVGQPLSFIYKPGGTGLIGMVELSRQTQSSEVSWQRSSRYHLIWRRPQTVSVQRLVLLFRSQYSDSTQLL